MQITLDPDVIVDIDPYDARIKKWVQDNGLDPDLMRFPIVIDTDLKRVTYTHASPTGERSEVTVSYLVDFPEGLL